MDFAPLAAALLARARELLPTWFPEGRFEGREFCIGDLSGSKGDSLKVNSQTGVWTDFAEAGSGGRDLISLYAAAHALKQGEAARELAERFGYTIEPAAPSVTRPRPPAAAPAALLRPNGHAEGFTGAHFKHGLPAELYPYRDPDGDILFFIARYDIPGADGPTKTFCPWRWDGEAWVMKAPPAPRPLFGLELLKAHPAARVLLVEGERCALSARRVLRPDANVVLTWPGGAQAVDAIDWEPLSARTVTIWPDADKPGREAAARIAARLLELALSDAGKGARKGGEVWVIAVPDDKPAGWDVADAIQEGMRAPDLAGFAKQHRRAVTRVPPKPAVSVPAAPRGSQAPEARLTLDPEGPGPQDPDNPGLGAVTHSETWQRWGLELIKGLPVPNIDNACHVISRHDRFSSDIWFDEFLDAVMIGDRPYDQESDAGPLCLYCQRVLKIHRMSPGVVDDAVNIYARTRSRHPLREWVDALTWDQSPLIEQAMHIGWGAAHTEYHSSVGRIFFLSMMARLYDPGCVCRTMTVFEGEQDEGKSTALAIIGGEYYAELTESMDTKDFLQALDGKWIVEIPELEALLKSNTGAKAIISRRVDRYRRSYGRRAGDHARSSIFAGTTNQYAWLSDETGATRFLPVRTGRIDFAWLQANREQLLAEARTRYKAGEDWYVIGKVQAKEQREARYIADPWEEAIRAYTAIREAVTISDIYSVLDISAAEQDPRSARRIGAVLRHLGYGAPRIHRPRGGQPVRLFERATASAPAASNQPLQPPGGGQLGGQLEREPGSDDVE